MTKSPPAGPIDRHVHTRWSLDNPHGPTFEAYLEIAEHHDLRVGFLDHYELLYKHDPRNPLREENFARYVARVEEVRASWGHVAEFGLEVDFYAHRVPETAAFLDQYADTFDLFVGSVHEIEDHAPVTLRPQLRQLVASRPAGFADVVDEYFVLERALVETGLFRAIAHPDVVFRFCKDVVPWDAAYACHPALLDLARACRESHVALEFNLSGELHAVHRASPGREVVQELVARGNQFFVGSDAHDLETFQTQIPRVAAAWRTLRAHGALAPI